MDANADLIIKQQERLDASERRHQALQLNYEALEQRLSAERQEHSKALGAQAAVLDEQLSLNSRLQKELGLLKGSVAAVEQMQTPKSSSKLKRERDDANQRALDAERALVAEQELTLELNQEKLKLQDRVGVLEMALSSGSEKRDVLRSAKKVSGVPNATEEMMAVQHAADVEAMRASLHAEHSAPAMPSGQSLAQGLEGGEQQEETISQLRKSNQANKVRIAELKAKGRVQKGVIAELKRELDQERKSQEESSINRSLQYQHAAIVAGEGLAVLHEDYNALEEQYRELEAYVEGLPMNLVDVDRKEFMAAGFRDSSSTYAGLEVAEVLEIVDDGEPGQLGGQSLVDEVGDLRNRLAQSEREKERIDGERLRALEEVAHLCRVLQRDWFVGG